MSEFIPSTITEHYKLIDAKEDVLEVSSLDMQSPVTITSYKSVHNLHTLCNNNYRGLLCCVKMQVMPRVNYPAMCYCNHVLGHPCLVSLLFIPSLYATFFNSKNFCLLSFFPAQLCSGPSTKVYKVLW